MYLGRNWCQITLPRLLHSAVAAAAAPAAPMIVPVLLLEGASERPMIPSA